METSTRTTTIILIVSAIVLSLGIADIVDRYFIHKTKAEAKQGVDNIGKTVTNATGKIDATADTSSKKSDDIKNTSDKIKDKTKGVSDTVKREQETIKQIKLNLEKSIVSHGFKIETGGI